MHRSRPSLADRRSHSNVRKYEKLKPPAFGSGAALVLVIAVAHVATGVPLLLPPGASGVGAGIYFLFAICRLTIFFCVGMMLMVGRWHVGE